MTVWLVVQGLVFALWAFVAFRALFRLFGVMQRQGDQALPGFAATLVAARVFWRDPAFARDRRLLLWLMVILFALSTGFAANS